MIYYIHSQERKENKKMRIVDERKQNTILFKEVEISHVFYVEDEINYGCNPYMRISKITDINYDYWNAINLREGSLAYLNPNEPVILCRFINKRGNKK